MFPCIIFHKPSVRVWGGQGYPNKHHGHFKVIFSITREEIQLPVKIGDKNLNLTQPTIHAAESPPPSPPQNQPEDNHYDYVNEHGEGDNFPGEDGAASGGIRTPATPHEADKQDDDGDVDDVDDVELTSKKKDGISKKSFPPTTKATVSVRLKHFNRPRTLIRDIKKVPSSASSARKKDKTEEASSLPRTSTKSSKPSLRKSSAATLHYLRSNPKPKTKQES